ncbi:Unknown protein, partial [Striga hermonthica]
NNMPLVEMIGMTPCNKNFLIAYAIVNNETEYSYDWVLQRLRLMLESDKQLSVIVSDKESGLITPIQRNFPTTPHLLCTWHINRDVEDNVYRLTSKNKIIAQNFTHGKWKKVVEANTWQKYKDAVEDMIVTYAKFPHVLDYVDKTWLAHKEKFVKVWTDTVLHFGNTTTCRVESSHATLKRWLETSTGSLDTVWEKIDKEIESQLTKVRETLESSRLRMSTGYRGFPFEQLKLRVSHYCMDILNDELQKMRDFGKDVCDLCDCALKYTHGLPCACDLREAHTEGTQITPNDIHRFWSTLSASVSGWTDHDYFRRLAEEVEAVDPATIRYLNHVIAAQLHPDEQGYKEPEVKENPRGRPKKKNSTKRDPSKWEYTVGGRTAG